MPCEVKITKSGAFNATAFTQVTEVPVTHPNQEVTAELLGIALFLI